MTTPPANPASYAKRFQAPEDVSAYETKEYGAGSYSSRVWQWQRPVVEQIIRDFRKAQAGPVRLLDFACGTGRVLAVLEPLVDGAVGVDISEGMAAVARTKCRSAQVRVGDILTQPAILGQDAFEVISCFRFVLNAEPKLRLQVLRQLRAVLRQPQGVLLVNVHGNAHSLRHPAIAWKRRGKRTPGPEEMLNEMTPGEVEALLSAAGFTIARRFGFGIMPPTFYRTPLRGLAERVDRSLAGENGWWRQSIDLLYVCRGK